MGSRLHLKKELENSLVNHEILMLITRGVLAQPPETGAHDNVLDDNPDRIGIWRVGFRGEGKPEYPGNNVKKQAREPTNTYDAESGI